MILLVLATALAVIGATLLVSALGLERLTDLVTIWCLAVPVLITVAGLLAGAALHSLRPGTLLLVTAVLTALAGAAAVVRRDTVRDTAALLRGALRRGAPRLVRRPVALVPLVLVLAVYGWRLLMAVRLPMSDWDGLGYHLIAPDTWVQNGAITHVPYTTGELIWADVYPQNGELLNAWSMAFLHDVRLAGLTPFVFAVLGAVAVTGLARNLGAGRRTALPAGLAYALTPIAVAQMGTGYVDVMAASCVLAGMQLVLSPVTPTPAAAAARRGSARPQPLFLAAGAAFGLAAGSKTTGVLAAALGVVLAMAVVVVTRRQVLRGAGPAGGGVGPTGALTPQGTTACPPNLSTGGPGLLGITTGLLTRRPAVAAASAANPAAPPTGRASADGAATGGSGAAFLHARLWLRHLMGPLLCVLLPILALGLYWYVRTWVAYGNPVFPYAMFGLPGWGGVHQLLVEQVPRQLAGENAVEQVLRSWWQDAGPPATAYGYDVRLGGLGPQWPLLLLPAVLVATVLAVRRRRLVLLWGVLAPAAVMLVACPVPWWSRFTLWMAGIGAVCFALAVTWLAPGGAAGSDRIRGTRRIRRIRRWTVRLATLALVGLLGLSAFWSVRRDAVVTNGTVAADVSQTWRLMGENYTLLNRTISPYSGYTALAALPPGSVIAVPNQLRPSFTHPYVGSYLQRRLVMFDAPATPAELAARLRATGADYVVLSPVPPAPDRPGTADLTSAVQADPAQFVVVARVRDGLLFRLVGGGT